jgi:hypothetical protein
VLGLIWAVAVLPADVQDFDAGREVIRRVGGLPRLARVWADAIYRAFASWLSANCEWVLEVVTRRPGAVGVEVQPKRWLVERALGWSGRCTGNRDPGLRERPGNRGSCQRSYQSCDRRLRRSARA